jgi:integral membrane sensor domain MASE1
MVSATPSSAMHPAGAQEPPAARLQLKDLFLLPLFYFLSAEIGVRLSVMPEGMAILWPPNGVLLAYFIRFGPSSMLPLGILAVAAELIVDVPKYRISDALQFGLINVAECALAATLLRRMAFDPTFRQVADLARFVVAGPVIAAFGGAILGALVYSRLPGSQTAYLQFLRIWWFGDALGILIVTPFVLSLWTRARSIPRFSSPLRLHDVLVGLGAAFVVALLLAARQGTLMGTHVGPVLLLPFAIYAGVRLGPSAAAITVSGVTAFILVLTTQGRNPFGADTAREAVIHAQEFAFVLSVMTLGLAALVAHVRASQRTLETLTAELHRRAEALSESHEETLLAQRQVMALNDELEARVQARTQDLQEALSQVKQLSGLLPICAWCKAVRDDHDYWHSVEEYISQRTDAQFSHGICPNCAGDLERAHQTQSSEEH